MRREVNRLSEESFKAIIQKVETFYSVKAEMDLKELKETIFELQNDLDALTSKFNREKAVFNKDNIESMQERHNAKRMAESIRQS
jgi:hypothetical protein